MCGIILTFFLLSCLSPPLEHESKFHKSMIHSLMGFVHLFISSTLNSEECVSGTLSINTNWMNKCWLEDLLCPCWVTESRKETKKNKEAIHELQQRCLQPSCVVPETCSSSSFPFSPKQLPLSCTTEVTVLLDKEPLTRIPYHVSFKPNCSPKDETLCSSPQVSLLPEKWQAV